MIVDSVFATLLYLFVGNLVEAVTEIIDFSEVLWSLLFSSVGGKKVTSENMRTQKWISGMVLKISMMMMLEWCFLVMLKHLLSFGRGKQVEQKTFRTKNQRRRQKFHIDVYLLAWEWVAGGTRVVQFIVHICTIVLSSELYETIIENVI